MENQRNTLIRISSLKNRRIQLTFREINKMIFEEQKIVKQSIMGSFFFMQGSWPANLSIKRLWGIGNGRTKVSMVGFKRFKIYSTKRSVMNRLVNKHKGAFSFQLRFNCQEDWWELHFSTHYWLIADEINYKNSETRKSDNFFLVYKRILSRCVALKW